MEALHAQLREKEIELELQERRLEELSTALQRREADLNTYARKLQTSAREASQPAVREVVGDGTTSRGEQAPAEQPQPSEADPTARRLQFWSR